MKTPVFLSGSTTGPSNSAVNYFNGLVGQSSTSSPSAWSTTLAAAEVPVAVGGAISDLRVRVPTAVATGTWTFALLKNGVVALSVAITGGGTTGVDTSSVSVSAGDKLAVRITPSGTPTAQGQIQVAFLFDGTGTAGAMFAHASGATVSGTNVFATPGSLSNSSVTANTTRLGVMPCAGTISAMYVQLSAAPGGATNRSVTVVKNGVDTGLTLTISGANTSGNVSSSVSFTAGDTITLRCGTTSTVASRYNIGLDWTPTNAGEVPIFGMFGGAPSTTTTVWIPPSGSSISTEGTETNVLEIAPVAFDIIAFRADIGTAPGGGKSRAFTIRKGATTDTSAAATISGAGVVTASWSGTVSIAAADLLSLKTVPSGTPAAAGSAKTSAVIKVPTSGTTGQIKVWSGAAWLAKPVKVWNGSSWVVKPLKRWNGSAWVVTNY